MPLTYKGRPFQASKFAEDIQSAIVGSAKEQLRERFSAIRHPQTGEFPTVQVMGNTLDDLRLVVEGSPALLEIIKERMNGSEREAATLRPVPNGPPKAFLSYASEDRDVAKRIAEGLQANGVETWWADWEMKVGDSLRQRIDEGLADCTHFIVLLSPVALDKPWVNQEMDAGLVRRIAGQARFIPLRLGLSPSQLPPLLSGMFSPGIEEGETDADLRDLINDIHGVSRKPPLGAPPASVGLPATGYSSIATAIAKIFVDKTPDALSGQAQTREEELAEAVNASVADVKDALHELRDLVTVSFGRVRPKTELFAAFDGYFKEWKPEDDALTIAADLVNDPNVPWATEEIAARYGWDARRINPALAYLLARKLIADYRAFNGNRFLTVRVVKTDAARRFVESRS